MKNEAEAIPKSQAEDEPPPLIQHPMSPSAAFRYIVRIYKVALQDNTPLQTKLAANFPEEIQYITGNNCWLQKNEHRRLKAPPGPPGP